MTSQKNMSTASRANAGFLHQERVDKAVETAMPIDSDDLEFLKSHADGLALSIEIIFSNGGWWLPKTDGTEHLVDAVLANRRDR